MLLLRKIIFYLFLLIYLVFCPLVILSAMGIILKPGTQTIEKTGIISLASNPPGATILINHSRFADKTPALVRNLPPGEYTVKLILKDYLPWIKTLKVKEEEATVYENILLIPQKWEFTEIVAKPLQDIIPIKSQPFFVVTTGPLLKDFFLFRPNESGMKKISSTEDPADMPSDLHRLLSINSFYSDAKLIHFFSQKNSPFFLLQAKVKGKQEFLWIDARKSPVTVQDVSDLFPEMPGHILWDSRDEKILFSLKNNSLTKMDLGNKALYPNLVQDIISFGLFEHKVYGLTDQYAFERMDYNGENKQTLLKNSKLSQSLFSTYKNLKTFVLTEHIILFLSDEGALLSNQLPHLIVKEGVKDFALSKDRKHVLIWTTSKIGVVDFSRRADDDVFEHGPILSWIKDNGQDIEQAVWINDDAQILYRDQEKILILDSRDGDTPLEYEILQNKKNSSFAYMPNTGTLLYLDKNSGYLMSVFLLPPKSSAPVPLLNLDKKRIKDGLQNAI